MQRIEAELPELLRKALEAENNAKEFIDSIDIEEVEEGYKADLIAVSDKLDISRERAHDIALSIVRRNYICWAIGQKDEEWSIEGKSRVPFPNEVAATVLASSINFFTDEQILENLYLLREDDTNGTKEIQQVYINNPENNITQNDFKRIAGINILLDAIKPGASDIVSDGKIPEPYSLLN
jgi:hypothetical protein